MAHFYSSVYRIVLEADFNGMRVGSENLNISFSNIGNTTNTGIEILGAKIGTKQSNLNLNMMKNLVEKYSECNPDVNFCFKLEDSEEYEIIEATSDTINRLQETSIGFYTFSDFIKLIDRHKSKSDRYRLFLKENFSDRVARKSLIKEKIENLDLNDNNVLKQLKEDFKIIRLEEKNKPTMLLRKHLINFENSFESVVTARSIEGEKETFPCIIEYQVFKSESENRQPIINVYVNNTITYFDEYSLVFEYDNYDIKSTSSVFARTLGELLKDFKGFEFSIHLITPYLDFSDLGKTKIVIDDFIKELVNKLRKEILKEKKRTKQIRINRKKLMRENIEEAYNIASNGGQYAVTARQIWYKMREIIGKVNHNWEAKNSYNSFTQDIVTEFIDSNPDIEEKINFADRGNFYVNGIQKGLGTANVRNFINQQDDESDMFILDGGIYDKLTHREDFSLKYKYNKALFIEKTGFDAIFQAEKIDEKYNMVVISGQGFATRAARKLLYYLQHEQGLKLYCMHDLDIDGVSILNSIRQANEKFKYDLDIVDLGVTLQDVEKYSIKPEIITLKDNKSKVLKTLDYDYQRFFRHGRDVKRVELNAFTTAQLLDIIDKKLAHDTALPTINLSSCISFDNKSLREVAFLRYIKEKYEDDLSKININIDLSKYDGQYTVKEADEILPRIREELVNEYYDEILKNMAV